MEQIRSKEAALARRSRSGDLRDFLEQGNGCGWCSHPLRLKGKKLVVGSDGTVRLVFTSSSLPDGVVLKACGNRRETRCPACASVYKADARHLVRAGLEGGKGIDPSVAKHPAVLLTLTAPSFGKVHCERSKGPCHLGYPNRRCEHGRPVTCFERHQPEDEIIGTPLCLDCYRYEDAVIQNALAPELWRRTSIYIDRKLAKVLGVVQAEVRKLYRVSFVRVAELQRRGAIHLHVIVRLDRRDGDVPEISGDDLALACMQAANAVNVEHRRGTARWGPEIDVQVLDREGENAAKVAAYIAKYSVKSSERSGGLDSRIKSNADLVHRQLHPHLRRLVETAWVLADDPSYGQLNLRSYAHNLGYGGYFLAKSRSYSTTFSELRSERARWRAGMSPETTEAESGSLLAQWTAVGVGWANPGEMTFAEETHRTIQGLRRLAYQNVPDSDALDAQGSARS